MMGPLENIKPRPVIWRYEATITQPVGVPAASGVLVTPQNGQALDLIHYMVAVANNAAAETYRVAKASLAAVILSIYDEASMDNQQIYGPNIRMIANTVTAATIASIGKPQGDLIAGSIDTFRVEGTTTLANTDAFTIRFTFEIFGPIRALPTVTVIGAGVVLSNITTVIG